MFGSNDPFSLPRMPGIKALLHVPISTPTQTNIKASHASAPFVRSREHEHKHTKPKPKGTTYIDLDRFPMKYHPHTHFLRGPPQPHRHMKFFPDPGCPPELTPGGHMRCPNCADCERCHACAHDLCGCCDAPPPHAGFADIKSRSSPSSGLESGARSNSGEVEELFQFPKPRITILRALAPVRATASIEKTKQVEPFHKVASEVEANSTMTRSSSISTLESPGPVTPPAVSLTGSFEELYLHFRTEAETEVALAARSKAKTTVADDSEEPIKWDKSSTTPPTRKGPAESKPSSRSSSSDSLRTPTACTHSGDKENKEEDPFADFAWNSEDQLPPRRALRSDLRPVYSTAQLRDDFRDRFLTEYNRGYDMGAIQEVDEDPSSPTFGLPYIPNECAFGSHTSAQNQPNLLGYQVADLPTEIEEEVDPGTPPILLQQILAYPLNPLVPHFQRITNMLPPLGPLGLKLTGLAASVPLILILSLIGTFLLVAGLSDLIEMTIRDTFRYAAGSIGWKHKERVLEMGGRRKYRLSRARTVWVKAFDPLVPYVFRVEAEEETKSTKEGGSSASSNTSA